jgi:Flp pilus assembly protein TadD
LRQATAINPVFYPGWHDLGCILSLKGDFAGSQSALQTALLYTRNKAEIYENLGDLFVLTGQDQKAIANFQDALAATPGQPEVCVKLGQAFARNRENGQAIIQFQNALRLQPDNARAELGLAMILEGDGHDSDAMVHYRKLIGLETNSAVALNNLAWLLATDPDARLRNGREAVRLAEQACKLTHHQEAFLIGTLAAAYAEAGRFNDAVAVAQKARAVALAHGQKAIADANERLLESYKSGKAYHQAAKASP